MISRLFTAAVTSTAKLNRTVNTEQNVISCMNRTTDELYNNFVNIV